MKYIIYFNLLLFSTVTYSNQNKKNGKYILDAHYNMPELILMERKSAVYKGYGIETKLDLTDHLFSIYWDSKNKKYYFAEDGTHLIQTNGLRYKLDPQYFEKTFTGEILDPYLVYAGNIAADMRLYIDTRNKKQYIKKLLIINDSAIFYPINWGHGLTYGEIGDDRSYHRDYHDQGVIDYAVIFEGL